MTLLILAIIVVTLMFCSVVFFGAPYLPTLSVSRDDAFKLMGLKKGQHLLELGSGDGRILAHAAKQGIYATGYELNPLLVLYTKLRYFRHRRYIKVYCRNYWSIRWPETDAIYVFLLDKYMNKLHKKIVQELHTRNTSSISTVGLQKDPSNNSSHEVKLASFAFKIPDKQITRELNGIYLYTFK